MSRIVRTEKEITKKIKGIVKELNYLELNHYGSDEDTTDILQEFVRWLTKGKKERGKNDTSS